MHKLAFVLATMCLVPGASAQMASPATPARSGGLGGLLGSVLPNVGSVGAGNAAGLLGYCLKNKLMGAAGALTGATGTGATGAGAAGETGMPSGAQSVLERLTGRQDVQASPGYTAGQAGKVQTATGQSLSLDSLRGQLKTRMCSLVLDRAKSFL